RARRSRRDARHARAVAGGTPGRGSPWVGARPATRGCRPPRAPAIASGRSGPPVASGGMHRTVEPLDAAALRAALGGRWAQVDVVERTGSTNADLLVAAANGAPDR